MRTAILATVITTIANSAVANGSEPRHYFDLTGAVLDAETKQPIEGAFVVATYGIVRPGIAATASVCVKTLGARTGADGKFQFPVEKLDGSSPLVVNAIKPGYYRKTTDLPKANSEEWKKQLPQAYRNRNVYLQKQDPAHPSFRLSDGEEKCWEPESSEAAAAGIEFVEIEIAEARKYGASDRGIEALEDQIRLLSDAANKSKATHK